MKKRYLSVIAVSAMLVLLCSCASSSVPVSSSSDSSSSEASLQDTAKVDLSEAVKPEIDETQAPCPEISDYDEYKQLREELHTPDSERFFPCGGNDGPGFVEDNLYWLPVEDNETPLEYYADYQAVDSNQALMSIGQIGYFQPYQMFALFNNENNTLFCRRTDEYTMYIPYRVGGGGTLYVFFTTDATIKRVPDDFYCSYYFAYILRGMQYSDFSEVAVGDSIDKIIEIDSTAEFVKKNYSKLPNVLAHKYVLVLSDGIMILSYEDNGSDLVISSMEYAPDYIFKGELGLWKQNLNFTILPQDYPPVD